MDGALGILDGSVDGKHSGDDLDAKQAVQPVDWCILEFVKGYGVLPVVDDGLAKEDEDGFDAGCDGLFYALTAVVLCIDVVVNIYVMGSLAILAIGVLYAGAEGVRSGLGELGFLALRGVFP